MLYIVTYTVHEIVRNLSVITAVEESDGRDSSVVRRPIEIVSNPRHNLGRTVRSGMGWKGKVAPPGIEPSPCRSKVYGQCAPDCVLD